MGGFVAFLFCLPAWAAVMVTVGVGVGWPDVVVTVAVGVAFPAVVATGALGPGWPSAEDGSVVTVEVPGLL